MQVVILAGGYGTRLSEETDFIPKPMVKIGNLPILHHIMNYFEGFGHTHFTLALGYKSEVIVEYFRNFSNSRWRIDLVETGLDTSTGGRVKALADKLNDEFFMTYGDGLSNVNLSRLLEHHRRFDKVATVTAVRPPARFGHLEISNGLVSRFSEKDPQDSGWINGGFFCLKKSVCEFIDDYQTPLESTPMSKLVELQELSAFQHSGWWQPMDTLRDKRILQELWETGRAPWAQP